MKKQEMRKERQESRGPFIFDNVKEIRVLRLPRQYFNQSMDLIPYGTKNELTTVANSVKSVL